MQFISKRYLKAFLLFIFVLVGLRVYLPFAIQQYVNRTLDRVPDYDGHIGEVDVALWRGAYVIQDIDITKTTGKIPLPLFSCGRADFSVQWKALWRGRIVGEIECLRARLNIVHGASPQLSQTEIDDEWLKVVKDLFPLRINHFRLVNSEIHYLDLSSPRRVDVELTNLLVEGANFSNTRLPSAGLTATIKLRGKMEDAAPVALDATVEPAAAKPTFDLNASIRELPVSRLNDFLRAYAAVDAEKGVLSTDLEIASAKGKFKGFVKLIIKDLRILSVSKDGANPLQFLWEGLVATIAELFQNQRHSQLATEIPFSGNLDSPQPSYLHSIGAVLKNAFIQALHQGSDNEVSIEDVEH